MYSLKVILFICFITSSFLQSSGIEVADTHILDINSIQYSQDGDYFFTADSTYIYRWSFGGENLDMDDNFIQEFTTLEKQSSQLSFPVLAQKEDLFIEAIELKNSIDDGTKWGQVLKNMNASTVHVCTIDPVTKTQEVLIELHAGKICDPHRRRAALGPNGHMVISAGQSFIIWQWTFNRDSNNKITLMEQQ